MKATKERDGVGGRVSLPTGEKRDVPRSALFVSVLALGTAAAGNIMFPEQLENYFALLWLLALIPPFLLAYYKGWEGATVALAIGMILLVGVEVGGSYLADREVRWWIVTGFIVILITVSLGAGVISEQLHRERSSALDLAYLDHLTGLPNRRTLEWFLGKEFAEAERGRPLTVVLFDIDGFKLHNDESGHAEGDRVLKVVADVLGTNTRASDLTGRMGGDEFLSILGGETADTALVFAQRVLSELESRTELVGLSAGIASYGPGISSAPDLLEQADQALYEAKSEGGGRVVRRLSAEDAARETTAADAP